MKFEIAEMWADVLGGQERPDPHVEGHWAVFVPRVSPSGRSLKDKQLSTSRECFKEAVTDIVSEMSWGPR